MTMKKLVALLIVAVMLFLCSCGTVENTPSDNVPSQPTQQPAAGGSFSLLFCASDYLNPYTAASKLNRQLGLLLYDPLVKLDPYFQPQYILADTVEVVGKNCTVTLKTAYFTDGSPVTADDVVYSMNLAVHSALPYSEQLAEITSFYAEDGTVRLNLTKSDPYIANILDFPVIKSGSDKLTDENNIILPPIGSGKYIYDKENSLLKANPAYQGGVPSIDTITLINAPDDDVVTYNLESGYVSVFSTELSDGVVPPMVGTALPVNLNNLVYLGVNMNRGRLSDVKMRYVLSDAVNRSEICSDAYYSYASPATGLFNPAWSDAGGLQNLSSSSNPQNAVANLEELGYNNKNGDGFYTDSAGNALSFTLVAYSGNPRRIQAANLIKTQLEAFGIRITVLSLGWEEYTAALTAGNFDLYIAEVKLTGNMDVTELVTSKGSLAYGIAQVAAPIPDTGAVEPETNGETDPAENEDEPENTPWVNGVPLMDSAVSGFYHEELSLIDIINAFNAELPIIPICYRLGITVCDASLTVSDISSVSDAYFGIDHTTFK